LLNKNSAGSNFLVDVGAALGRTENKGLVARLGDVKVYVLGADNAGRPIAYWERVRDYWLEYFTKAGARVESYSVLRELRALDP
jgi:hypothetical protein